MTSNSERRIDWRQTRALVRCYFIMSFRSLPMRSLRDDQGRKGMGSLWLVLLVYGMLGGMLAGMTAFTDEVYVFSFIVHLMTMFVVGTSAMNEASEVLFNTNEGAVLAHRPIPAATLVLSKAITIIGFTSLIAAALNAFPTLALVQPKDARAITPLVHILSVFVCTVFVSAAVICMYGLLARLLGRERFQRVTTVAQIASTLFLAAGFQIVPRLFGREMGLDLTGLLHESKVAWFMPPCWFAALDSWLGSSRVDAHVLHLALVGVAVTVILSWIGVLRLPSTGNNAASLQEESRRDVVEKPIVESRGWMERLIAPWLRHSVELASFRLAKAYLSRERTLKVRLAAALAFFAVFPILTIMDSKRADVMPIVLFWMTAFVPVTVLETLRISANPAASDLFLYAPIEDGTRIFHGVRKAAIVFIQVPILLYILLVSAWVMRDNASHLLLVLPALLVMPTVSLLPAVVTGYLPLSAVARTGQRTTQSTLIFVSMIPAAVVGVVSYFALQYGLLWLLLVLELPLVVALHIFLLRLVRRAARGPERGSYALHGRKSAHDAT